MTFIRHYDSPLGGVLLAADIAGLTGLWFNGAKYFAANLPEAREEKRTPILDETARWLDIYFAGGQPDFTPPLHLIGSDFRRRVWKRLLEIPYGQTASYGRVAELVGHPRAARAVGSACATNPLPIILPCHRVTKADGSLGNYTGGTEIKRALLDLERPRT